MKVCSILIQYMQGNSDNCCSEGRQPAFPIMRLPGELIAEVFSWCILGVCSAASRFSFSVTNGIFIPSFHNAFADSPAPYSWLVIRHVCRAWRQVALAYPQLSAHIFLTRPECVQDMLSRAGTLPLHIYDPSSPFVRSNLNDVVASSILAMRHLEHISYGSLIFRDDVGNVEQGLTRGKISIARSLHLMLWQHRDSPGFPIPGFCFPELRDLSLCHVSISGIRGMFPVQHLRTLKLVQCEPIAIDRLIALIKPAQCLEELVLSRSMEARESWPHIYGSHSTANFRGGVVLPHLRHLHFFEKSAAAALFFLYHIVHPSSTTIHLTFNSFSQGAHADCECLLMMLLAKIDNWSESENASVQSMRLGVFDWDDMFKHLQVKLWRNRLPSTTLVDLSECDSPFFELVLGAGHRAFFTGLLRRLPLAHVISASLVHNAIVWDVVDWEELLAVLPSVRELGLKYYTTGSPNLQLYQIEPHGSDGSDAHILCPRVEVLHIREEHWNTEPLDEPIVQELPQNALTLARLAQGLVARSEQRPYGSQDNLSTAPEANNSIFTVPLL